MGVTFIGPQGPVPGSDVDDMLQRLNDYTRGGAAPQPSPDIISPQGSNVGTGKQVGPWTNPFTDAYINPQTGQPEYVGGPGATIGPGSAAARYVPSWLTNRFAIGSAAVPTAIEGLRNWAHSGNIPSSAAFGGDTGGVPIPDQTPSSSPGFDVGGPNWSVQHSGSGYGGMPPDAFTVNAAPTGPRTPVAPSGAVAPRARVATIPNTARAQVPPAAAAAAPNNRFGLFQYDVPGTPGATQLPGGAGRAGQNRSPYITALDLSHLFGGGQPNPANVPAANVQPMRGGPLSKGFTTKAPWDYGPIQKGRSWPQGPDYSDIPVGYHSGYQ